MNSTACVRVGPHLKLRRLPALPFPIYPADLISVHARVESVHRLVRKGVPFCRVYMRLHPLTTFVDVLFCASTLGQLLTLMS